VTKPRLPTELIHHPYRPPAGFDAVQPGVHKASTVIFPNVAAHRARDWRDKAGYTYGLHGTPTTFTLEARIATLDGGRHCVLTPSGLSAISLADFALLKSGDEVLLPDNVYGPSLSLARAELAHWGITHRLYDPLDAAALAGMIGPATKLLWVEAAGSVTMEFPDVRGLARAARERNVLVAVDATWAAGIAYDGFALGADVVMHALTKYPSGGGDVLMGSLTTRDPVLHERLLLAHMRIGFGVGANDAELVLRSLPSLPLRYAAQDASARRIAERLGTRRDAVARVLHPALPGSPGHEHWAATCSAAAGLFAVEFDARFVPAQVDAFVDALKLFRIGSSWGGPVSLVVPYALKSMRQRPAYAGTIVRLAIGLEATEDLIADLEQALAKLA
jgi:cystathionine beta-lyase